MNTIITISREFGSGGHQIGERLAEALGIPFYDKEIIERSAKDSGICQEFFEEHDEKYTNSLLYSLVVGNYSMTADGRLNPEMPMNQKIFLAQFDAIKNMAREGACVIVGRCADYVLSERKNTLSVFISADMEDRKKRVAQRCDIKENKLFDFINKNDKKRANYYNFYTDRKWGTAKNYDLCINSSALGIEGAVELIKKAVELKEST